MSTIKKVSSNISYIFPLLLVVYEIALYLSNDAYLPALPTIAHDLKTTHHFAQLTLTVWFLGAASMQLILGPVSDHFGRRPILFFGGLIFIVSTIGCAITYNIYLLLILRFIQGTTITSMVIAGYATIHEVFDQEKAIHTLAVMNSITILAPSFGPLLGAIILQLAKWQWIFFILAAWAIFMLIGLYFKMPETVQKISGKIQLRKIFTPYKSIIINQDFMLHTFTACCLFAAMIAWITAGPFLLIDHFNFNTLEFGFTQVFIFGGFILGTRCVKPLMKRYNLATLINFGIFIALAGSIYAFITGLFYPNISLNIIGAMIIIAFGVGLPFPILNRLSIEASNAPMGSRIAVFSCLIGVSGMLSSGVISVTYSNTLSSLSSVLLVLIILAGTLKLFVHQTYKKAISSNCLK